MEDALFVGYKERTLLRESFEGGGRIIQQKIGKQKLNFLAARAVNQMFKQITRIQERESEWEKFEKEREGGLRKR